MIGHGSRRCVSTNFTSWRKRSSSRPASLSVPTRLLSVISKLSSRGIPCGSASGTSSSSPSIAVAAPRRRYGERRRFGSLLREELGLDPSPALRELEARVLNDDPTLLQPPVVVTTIGDATTPGRAHQAGWSSR